MPNLNYGMRAFFFIQEDDSDPTYDYVSFVNNQGVVLIGRYAKDGLSALYFEDKGDYTTIWAGRTGYTYTLPKIIDQGE